MINLKNTLALLFLALSISLYPSQSAQDNERYQEIIQNFSIQNQSFYDSFIPTEQDITIITHHKENAEKELLSYQKSWVPLFLKIVGGAFGLDATLRSASVILTATNAPRELWDIKRTVHNYIGYPIKPIGYAVHTLANPVTQPMAEKLREMYYQKESISGLTFDLARASILAGLTIPSAIIATYLFKKANSYQSEIERLEKEIAMDDMILQTLGSVE